MHPQLKWKAMIKTAVVVSAVLAITYGLFTLSRPDSSGDFSRSLPAQDTPAAEAPHPVGENASVPMQPGQTRPGSRPGTVIVQPFQPGPPKEISSNYRVPSHRDDARITRTDDGRIIFEQAIDLAHRLHANDTDAEEDIQILDAILGYYRMMHKSNPVAGENFEVINTLAGKNRQSVVVFPTNHPDLDEQGNLLDRWGTPYFFHAISATMLDIQSAGPDRERGSADDIKLGYRLPELD